jgi:hypothetical protein
MATCQFRPVLYEGFQALELANDHVRLIALPEIGGKIASILHPPTQHEWLWRNPYLSYRRPEYDTSYIRLGDLGGLDECFPTVAPTAYPAPPWAGTAIPDHGELWCQAWETTALDISDQRMVWSAVCHGVRLPYRFERTLILEADSPGFELRYRVSNPTAFPMPFVWCIHPLLKLAPGMRLSLPAGIESAQVGSDRQIEALDDWLTIPPPEAGRAVKAYLTLAAGSSPVETALIYGERSLRFQFVPDEISHVGLWLNYGGWSGLNGPPYYNLGLEPCIGSSDSLAEAAAHPRQHGQIPPQAERRWSLTVRLT